MEFRMATFLTRSSQKHELGIELWSVLASIFCVIQAMPLRFVAVLFAFGLLLPLRVSAQQGTKEWVGRAGTNRIVTPVNQVLTPYGRQVELPGLRPQAIALSP